MTMRAPFDAGTAGRGVRGAILLVWLAVVAVLIARHVPWRDEVRALTLALAGGDMLAMLRGVRGEGHPALWYVMLRAGHDVVPVPQVLQAVAALVGAGAAALFAGRAPFRWWAIALALSGGFFLFEYTLSARNYGIAMLLLFALAAVPRGRGVLTGVLLALLANTSVPAVLYAGAFVLFLALEGRDARARRATLVAAGIAMAGMLVCFATVYPPVNDAAIPPHPGGVTVATVLRALAAVAPALSSLVPAPLGDVPGVAGLFAALLLASPFGLIRSPGGFVAAGAALIGSVLFFGIVYPGSYRHHALYLVFLLTLHWMVANGRGGQWPERFARVRDTKFREWGQWALVGLLALQLPTSVEALARPVPYSRARDFAALLRTPPLHRAIVIASPDFLVEPLFYHTDNPAWLVREKRFARTVRYSRKVIVDLTLADVLADARRVARATGRPVVIALQAPPDPAAPAVTVADGYVTTFTTTPAQVREFLGATRHLATFGGSPTENYAVYRLVR